MESDVHKKIVSGRKGIMTDQVLVVESEMTTRKSTSNSSTIQLAPAQATAVIAEPELDGDLVRPRTAALAEERMTSARSATASTAALSARPGAEHGNFRRSEEVPNYISSTIVPRHDALQSVVCTSDHADHRNKGVSAARSGGDAARETTTVDKEQGATGMASVSVQQNQNRNRNNNSSTSSTSLERVPIHLQQHDEYRHETKNDVQVAGGKVSASTCTVAADLVQHPAANPNPSRSGGPAVQHQVDRYQSSATQDQPRQGELQLYNREPMIPPDTVTRVTKTKAAHSNSQKKKKKKKSSSKSAVTSPRPRVDEVPPEEVAPASASRATSCCLPSCLRRHLMMMRSSFVRSKDDDPRAAETTTTFSTRTLLSSRRRRLLSFRWWKELMCDKRPAHFRAGSTNNEESLTAPLQLELQHPWDADADRANSRGDALGGETSAISAVEDGATTYNATTAPALSSTGPSTSTGADERSFPAEGAGASHLQRRGTFCEEDDKKQMKLQSRRSTSSSRFSWWKVIVTLYLVLITMFVLRRALKIRRLKRKLRQAYALREVLARRARRRAAVMMRSDGHDSEETPHAGQRDLNYSVNRYSEDIDAVQLLASARPFSTSTTSGLPRAAGAKTSRRSSLYNNLHIKNLYAPDEDEHYDNKARREVGSSALFPWSSWSSDGVVSAGGATATAATTKKIHRKNNLRGSARLAALQQRSHSEDHAVPSDDVLATNREEKQDEPPSDHEGEVVPALEDPHAPPFGDVYLMKGKIASSSETEGEHQENYRETASEVVLPGRGDDHDLALPDAAAAQPRYRFRGTAAMRRKETQQAQEEAATQEEAAAPASSFLETSTGTHTEVARQETATQETARQETARQETARQETARQGTSGRQGTKAKQGFIDNIGDMPGDIGDTLFGMGWVTTFGAKDAVVNNLENVLDVGEQLAKPVEMFAQGTVSVGNELFVQHDLGGAWGEASHLVPQGRDFLVDTADDIVEAPANLIESALGFDIQWDKDWDFDFGDGDFGYVNFVKDEDTHDAQMDLANYGLNTVEWTVDTVTQPFDYMGQGLVNYVVDTFEVDNALGDLTNNAVIHGWDQEDWHDWLVHDPGSHFWDLNGDGTHAPNPLLFHGEAEGLTLNSSQMPWMRCGTPNRTCKT
ncbi:unnamed protein product [Amoebophrya sp. A120]|nr:unnamed protein product [Amoebophrya sp. A120]|eukprot:GSA120T00021820001.1